MGASPFGIVQHGSFTILRFDMGASPFGMVQYGSFHRWMDQRSNELRGWTVLSANAFFGSNSNRSLAALSFLYQSSPPSLLPAHANSILRHFLTILFLFIQPSLPLFHNLRLESSGIKPIWPPGWVSEPDFANFGIRTVGFCFGGDIGLASIDTEL